MSIIRSVELIPSVVCLVHEKKVLGAWDVTEMMPELKMYTCGIAPSWDHRTEWDWRHGG